MLDFDFEKEAGAEPGPVAKCVTLIGLVLFWLWVLILIF